MKKYLLFSAMLLLAASLSGTGQAESVFTDQGTFVIAKAVKLGRGNAYSVAADTTVDTGKTEIAKPQCDSSCTTCDNATGKCLGCPSGKRPNANRCVDNCYNVVCKSGYTTVNTAEGCCCEAESICGNGQIYNTTIGKCVDAVCPVGCLDDCSKGCGSCESGRYLNYSNGYCPTCSSAIANCATCTSSAAGPVCTSCESGYTLKDGQCVACPAGTYSAAGATSCTSCPTGYTSNAGSSSCTICASGYKSVNGHCVTCPAGYYYSIEVNGESGGCRKTGSLPFGALTNDSTQCRSGWAVPGGNDGIQGSHCGQGSVIGPF